ncbi:MAG: hypothetical protein Q8M88_11445 [Phenylobacterium sp.]|uniref:hypothetical protein n=1 Tax=Phenylobacterium sp. TaxID=1871053 RepID=UPI002735938C|nr:hypothetical protein [Phenylobacterium sp.]MDP3175035.1 hypothetical protein [Phenylobacterium sp.]
MARVLVACAQDGRVVHTGHHMTAAQFEAANARYAFRCSSCGDIHHWVRAEAWIEPARVVRAATAAPAEAE